MTHTALSQAREPFRPTTGRGWRRASTGMWLALALLFAWISPGPILAQVPPSVPGRVLRLDGVEGAVELPTNTFDGVEVVTVEAWANWQAFRSSSRVFDFVIGGRLVNIQNRGTGPDLWAEMFVDGRRLSLSVPGILVTNEWVHLALVVGPSELRLHWNGQPLQIPLSTEPDAPFRSAEFSRGNWIGRSNAKVVWPNDEGFRGRVDDVRVWRGERTTAQIRESMRRSVDGSEPGLLGAWDFDGAGAAEVRDRGPGGHHGTLTSGAVLEAGSVPATAGVGALQMALLLPDETSYIELPPNVFNDLSESTIEAWVRWDQPGGGISRLFNYGDALQDISLASIADGGGGRLWFVMGDADRVLHQIQAPQMVNPGEWCHVAGVSGPQGMHLYMNGFLVGSLGHVGSFAGLGSGARHFVGRSVTTNGTPDPLRGALRDLRVWSTARSQAEIRAGLYARLQGNEPGLVGLWTMDSMSDGLIRDSGPRGLHGKVQGSASLTPVRIPGPERLRTAARIRIVDAAGGPADGATVLGIQDGRLVGGGVTPMDGWVTLPFSLTGNVGLHARRGDLRARLELDLDELVRSLPLTLTLQEVDPGDGDPAGVAAAVAAALRDRDRADREGLLALIPAMSMSDPLVMGAIVELLGEADTTLRFAAMNALTEMPLSEPLERVYQKRSRAIALVFGALLAPFILFHLLLYLFDRKGVTNLYYALLVAAASIPSLLPQASSDGLFDGELLALLLGGGGLVMAGLRLVYALFRSRLPRQFWVFAVLVVGLGVLMLGFSAFTPTTERASAIRAICIGVAVAFLGLVIIAGWIEMIRVLVLAVFRRQSGARIIGVGMLLLLVFNVGALVVDIFWGG